MRAWRCHRSRMAAQISANAAAARMYHAVVAACGVAGGAASRRLIPGATRFSSPCYRAPGEDKLGPGYSAFPATSFLAETQL
jgi:hypothetical protein